MKTEGFSTLSFLIFLVHANEKLFIISILLTYLLDSFGKNRP